MHRLNASRTRMESLEPRQLLSAAAAPAMQALATGSAAPRIMENLGRGVVAVRASSSQILVSWRLLALDDSDIAFNVYRAANGGAAVKLNSGPLTGGTNYTDTTANFAANNSYFVRPVIDNIEQAASASYTLTANHAVEPVVRVPLRDPLPGYTTKFVWVGDLDGDGEFDYVIDRRAPGDPNQNEVGISSQRVEAYKSNGTFLWEIDLGPNSLDIDNIEPGASTISVGNWDGLTVADMDSDGKAEVLLKTANGVKFADGQVLTHSNNDVQFISVINGMTGAERARVQWQNDYPADGPMGMMFGVGSADGVHPTLYVKGKNRVGNGGFNMTVATFDFNGTTISQRWKWNRGSQNCPDGHNIRIIDVNGDGKDEFLDIGFALNSDGTLRYSLATTGGIVHGDRFHVGDLDPNHPGLEGYGVQQDNPSLLYDDYYDASTGQMIWQHFATSAVDVGRGQAADIDPRYPGFETWAFDGVWNAPTNTQITTGEAHPWPQLSMQWDGDLLGENLNDGKIENWNYETSNLSRLVTQWHYDSTDEGSLPMFYGDIFGDWREEVVTLNTAYNSLTIFSTDQSTPYRIYTLAQDPAYRNCMSTKGYYQTNQLDYYLGDGMSTPPTPNIVYAQSAPAAPTALTATPLKPQQINLSWATVSGAASYLVKRASTPGGPYTTIASGLTAATYADTSIAPGQTYYYVVSAASASQAESGNSPEASAAVTGIDAVYQAEQAAIGAGSVVDSDHSGYHSSGFVNLPASGGFVQFNNVFSGAAAPATIRFRYALGASAPRSGNLIVNGVSQTIRFDSTGAWNSWTTISLSVNLAAGSVNAIRLESTGEDLANIDELQVSAPGPQLTSATYLYQHAPNRLVFAFDRDVSGLGIEHLTIQRGGGAAIVAAAVAYDPATWTATYTMPGVLEDGNYRATLQAGGLAGSAAVDLSITFFALAGDANHDGVVDTTDLGLLSLNWNTAGKTYEQGDFNDDGSVDVGDIKILSENWQKRASDLPAAPAILSLPLPVASPAAPSSSSSRRKSR
jgi:hypothetical protein